MAQKPRTPVHFPRMKVRGRRNRAKLAARHEHLLVIPHARAVPTATGYRFFALAGPEPGAVMLKSRTVVDGYGRTVRDPDPAPRKPDPAPESAPFQTKFSFSAKVSGDTSAIADLLFGRNPDGEG